MGGTGKEHREFHQRRRKDRIEAAQKQPFRKQVNILWEVEHYVLSASCFSNVIAGYAISLVWFVFPFPDKSDEQNTDQMSSLALLTQTLTLKRPHGSRTPCAIMVDTTPMHKVNLSFGIRG